MKGIQRSSLEPLWKSHLPGKGMAGPRVRSEKNARSKNIKNGDLMGNNGDSDFLSLKKISGISFKADAAEKKSCFLKMWLFNLMLLGAQRMHSLIRLYIKSGRGLCVSRVILEPGVPSAAVLMTTQGLMLKDLKAKILEHGNKQWILPSTYTFAGIWSLFCSHCSP